MMRVMRVSPETFHVLHFLKANTIRLGNFPSQFLLEESRLHEIVLLLSFRAINLATFGEMKKREHPTVCLSIQIRQRWK